MGRFFRPDLDQDRTALNAASGRLARANRIPNSHTATDYDSHASATCSSACRLPGSYDLGKARKLRHSPPDLLPPLTISVRYILRRRRRRQRRRQRQIDYPQPANPPTNQSHRNPLRSHSHSHRPYRPCPPSHLSVPFTLHACRRDGVCLPPERKRSNLDWSPFRLLTILLVHHTCDRFAALPLPCALAFTGDFHGWMQSASNRNEDVRCALATHHLHSTLEFSSSDPRRGLCAPLSFFQHRPRGQPWNTPSLSSQAIATYSTAMTTPALVAIEARSTLRLTLVSPPTTRERYFQSWEMIPIGGMHYTVFPRRANAKCSSFPCSTMPDFSWPSSRCVSTYLSPLCCGFRVPTSSRHRMCRIAQVPPQ